MDTDRSKRLSTYISAKALEGFTVVDKNMETLTAVLKKEKEMNHTLHLIITLLSCGIWGIGWLILYFINKTKTIRVSIDDSGNLIEEIVQS